MIRVKCLEPIISSSCNMIILGTAPGGQSLLHQEYYAHGGNNFWPLMQVILNAHGVLSYFAKKELLLQSGIALWDVIKECDRKTSKDSDIENEIPNDLNVFLKDYPLIKKIVFNGHNPKSYFDTYIKLEKQMELEVAKSTSSSNNRNYSFDDLVKIWKPLIK